MEVKKNKKEKNKKHNRAFVTGGLVNSFTFWPSKSMKTYRPF